MESSKDKDHHADVDEDDLSAKLEKNNIELREGNIAYDIERPLFDTDACIDLAQLKKDFARKINLKDGSALSEGIPAITGLPSTKYLTDKSEDVDQETCILASYPRSGNTLLRAYLEKMMGLVTGSDCDIEKKLNKELLTMGLQGEGLVDKRVLVVKTHYPERYGKTKFYSEKCILEVRNPLDAVTSLFNMVCTGSHNKSIHNDDYGKFRDQWHEFLMQEITVWKDFHDFWLNSKIPVHIIRYEDILGSPKATMMKLMRFILNEPDIEGTVIERYIDLTVQEKAPEIYKPRQGQVNSNLEKFNKEELGHLFEYASDQLTKFGYEETFTGTKPEKPVTFIDEFNEESLKKSIFNSNESDEITSIFINYPALLLRKKTEKYPDGRTSYRFKRFLRKKVTIIDKTAKPGEQQQK